MNERETDRCKIDELIATRVMGWTTRENDVLYWWLNDKPVICREKEWSDGAWSPTTNAQHAKQVREKLAERFVFTGLLRRADYAEMDSKEFRFYVQDGLSPTNTKPDRFEAWAETEELAIAKCALKAFHVEMGE